MDDETQNPTNAPTNSPEESTAGVVLDMLRADQASTTDPYEQEAATASQSPSLTTADKWYAGISGFLIGVVIALALLAAGYILYQLMFSGPEGSAHDIDAE